jgi:class 3 adenylate cyclase
VRVERRLVAILAADIVGYSRLIEADEAAMEKLDNLVAGHIEDANKSRN